MLNNLSLIACIKFRINIDISYLLDKYFQREIIDQATCPHCEVVGRTAKNLNIINTPQVLVIHLPRFHSGLDKIDTFVKFHTDFGTHYITDDNGQQVTYRLTGAHSSYRNINCCWALSVLFSCQWQVVWSKRQRHHWGIVARGSSIENLYFILRAVLRC